MPRRAPLYLAAIFVSLLIPGMLQAGVVPLKMALILKEFNLNSLQFGILSGGIALLASVLGASAAWLVPRYGMARVWLSGYVLFAVGLGGIALLPAGYWCLLLGIFTAWGMAYLHLGNGLAVNYDPKRGAMYTNLLHGFNALGKALGPLVATIGTGWREPFLTVAGLGALAGLLGWKGWRSFEAQKADPDNSTTGDTLQASSKEALRKPLFWLCALLFFPIVGMEQVVVFWLPNHLRNSAGLPADDAVFHAYVAASILLWAECLGRFGAPIILRKISPLTLLSVSLICPLAILVGTEMHIWTGPLGLIALAVCGLGFAAPWPTFFALACEYLPEHRSLLAIASGAATSLAFIAFSALGGYLGHTAGLQWSLRLSPVLALATLIGVWVARSWSLRRAEGSTSSPQSL